MFVIINFYRSDKLPEIDIYENLRLILTNGICYLSII